MKEVESLIYSVCVFDMLDLTSEARYSSPTGNEIQRSQTCAFNFDPALHN